MSKTFCTPLSCYQPSPSQLRLDVSLPLWTTERETENRDHKILKQNLLPGFPPISFKLARPTTCPNLCVIRWFSCLSIRANLGCEILITVNGHYKFTIRVYGVPVYTHCQKNQMTSCRLKAYNEVGSITFSGFNQSHQQI